MDKFLDHLATYFKVPKETLLAAVKDDAPDTVVTAIGPAMMENAKQGLKSDKEFTKEFVAQGVTNAYGEVSRRAKQLPGFEESMEVKGDIGKTLENWAAKVAKAAPAAGDQNKDIERLTKELNEAKLAYQKLKEEDLPAEVNKVKQEFQKEKLIGETKSVLGSLKNLKVGADAALRIIEKDLEGVTVVETNGKRIPYRNGEVISRKSGAGVYDSFEELVKDVAGQESYGLFSKAPGADSAPQNTPGAGGNSTSGGNNGELKTTLPPGLTIPGTMNNVFANHATRSGEFVDRSAAAAEAAARIAAKNG
jgi:hypothetical protein